MTMSTNKTKATVGTKACRQLHVTILKASPVYSMFILGDQTQSRPHGVIFIDNLR